MALTANYKDKMLGCWIGKSIGGTIGGPLEGNTNFLDIPYEYPKVNIDNDDLDLQLVWLHQLEQRGLRITADDMGDAWLNHVEFPYDEYGVAMANLRMGIKPPATGIFNNWFTNGMGSPIRSEIWACIFPGRPEVAGYYAYLDAQVDHWDESVWGEVLFACMESIAFVESDLHKIIDQGLEYIPDHSLIKQAVVLSVKLHAEGKSLREAREKILADYNHYNFTDCVQNIAFTILGLLYGGGDFLKCILDASACGYDVDCTAATAGSIIGIIQGGKYILETAKVEVATNVVTSKGVVNFDAPKDVYELTDRVMKLAVQADGMDDLPTIAKPFILPDVAPIQSPYSIPVVYKTMSQQTLLDGEPQMDDAKEHSFVDGAFFDLLSIWPCMQPETLVFQTQVYLPKDQAFRVLPVWEGGMTLWVDGEKQYRHSASGSCLRFTVAV
jgi:ADP-ribosylglycohydrolase